MEVYDIDKKTILVNPDLTKGHIEVDIVKQEKSNGAFDEVPLYYYVPFTKQELLEIKINELKYNLDSTDYKIIKFIEGELSEKEIAPVKEQRKLWREEINKLENEFSL